MTDISIDKTAPTFALKASQRIRTNDHLRMNIMPLFVEEWRLMNTSDRHEYFISLGQKEKRRLLELISHYKNVASEN